jgi:hypothetical protein
MGPLFFFFITMLVVKVFGQPYKFNQVKFSPPEGWADMQYPLIHCATAGGYPKMDCYGTNLSIYIGPDQSIWPASKQDPNGVCWDDAGCVNEANWFKKDLNTRNMICSNYGVDFQPETLLYAMRGLPVTFQSRGGTAVTVKLNLGTGEMRMGDIWPATNFWIGGSDCYATRDAGVLTCNGTYSDGSPAEPAVWFNWKKSDFKPMEFEVGVYDRQSTPQPTQFPTPPPTSKPTLAPTRNYNPDCLRAPHTQICQDHVLWLRANWNLTAGPFPGVVNQFEDAGVDGTDCTILQYLSTAQNDTWCNCLCPEL